MGKAQREYFLREQLKAIQRELGELDSEHGELAELRERIDKAGLPAEAKREADRELARLERIPSASPESSVIRTYLELIVSLPWNTSTGGEAGAQPAGHPPRGVERPRVHAGRGRQDRLRLAGRSVVRFARGSRPRAEQGLSRQLPRRALRSLEGHVHHNSQLAGNDSRGPARPDGGFESVRLHGRGEGSARRAVP